MLEFSTNFCAIIWSLCVAPHRWFCQNSGRPLWWGRVNNLIASVCVITRFYDLQFRSNLYWQPNDNNRPDDKKAGKLQNLNCQLSFSIFFGIKRWIWEYEMDFKIYWFLNGRIAFVMMQGSIFCSWSSMWCDLYRFIHRVAGGANANFDCEFQKLRQTIRLIVLSIV